MPGPRCKTSYLGFIYCFLSFTWSINLWASEGQDPNHPSVRAEIQDSLSQTKHERFTGPILGKWGNLDFWFKTASNVSSHTCSKQTRNTPGVSKWYVFWKVSPKQVQKLSQHAALTHWYLQQTTPNPEQSVLLLGGQGAIFLDWSFSTFESSLQTQCTKQHRALSRWGINPRSDTLLGSVLPSLVIALTFATSLWLAAAGKSATKLSSPWEGIGNGPNLRCQPKIQFWYSPSLLLLQYLAHVYLLYSNKLYVNS